MIVVIPYSSGVRLAHHTIEQVDEFGEKYYISQEQTAIRFGVQYNVYFDENDAVDIALAMQVGGMAFFSEAGFRRWLAGEAPQEGDMMLEEPKLPL